MKKYKKIAIISASSLLLLIVTIQIVDTWARNVYIDLNSGLMKYQYKFCGLVVKEEITPSDFNKKFHNLLKPSESYNWAFCHGTGGTFTHWHSDGQSYQLLFARFWAFHNDIIGEKRTAYYLNEFMAIVSNNKNFDEKAAWNLLETMWKEVESKENTFFIKSFLSILWLA